MPACICHSSLISLTFLEPDSPGLPQPCSSMFCILEDLLTQWCFSRQYPRISLLKGLFWFQFLHTSSLRLVQLETGVHVVLFDILNFCHCCEEREMHFGVLPCVILEKPFQVACPPKSRYSEVLAGFSKYHLIPTSFLHHAKSPRKQSRKRCTFTLMALAMAMSHLSVSQATTIKSK